MQKVTIGTFEESGETFKWLSIGDIINICEAHKDKRIFFEGTDLSPCELGSWRGSYDKPRIGYERSKITGGEVASILSYALKENHYGYKGGEYFYSENEVPYIDNSGEYHEACVYGYDVVGKFVVLKTAINEY